MLYICLDTNILTNRQCSIFFFYFFWGGGGVGDGFSSLY
jgi:hypothetical protein